MNCYYVKHDGGVEDDISDARRTEVISIWHCAVVDSVERSSILLFQSGTVQVLFVHELVFIINISFVGRGIP